MYKLFIATPVSSLYPDGWIEDMELDSISQLKHFADTYNASNTCEIRGNGAVVAHRTATSNWS